MNDLDKKKYLFATIFYLANKLQTVGDKHLDGSITTKQWFLTAILSHLPDNPSLSEVANAMGTSRQNVKQLALKLKKNNYLEFTKQDNDARVTALRLTEKFERYWINRKDKDHQFVLNLFSELNNDELNAMYSGFLKITDKLEQISNEMEK